MLGMGMPGMPLGYVLGYWPGGYCPGYWPGGYWPPFGYCPGGYCPPVGYCAEASTPHRRIAAAAITAGWKGRRIMGMPPGSILYAFWPGGTPFPRLPARHALMWHRSEERRVGKECRSRASP